ncbi:Trafficking protein particle complex subunit [Aphelenchoides fujianensis]|nr:Trafficking protein particle complex subunit [Aphelenchoides fujianensis]
MTIYNLYIFNKDGGCIVYKEWNREKKSEMSRDEEFKLVYGMLLSLRSFSSKLSTKGGTQLVRGFRTSAYKMNYLETGTLLKCVLNTDPDAIGINELLRDIYSVFVETVLRNPLANIDQEITSELFYSRLDELVKTHHCYT